MADPTLSPALAAEMKALRSGINSRLDELVPAESAPPARLHRAIRYSLLAPGKRVRPILALLSAATFDCRRPEAALDPACAIEMVHAASLIVDDLPFMDDADERRGKATSHRAFGLQTATLASLALLNRAFSVLADAPGLDEAVRVRLVRLLSCALGDTGGAIAGQEEDLESPVDELSIADLERMVRHKTGALFVASAEAGALVAGARPEMLAAARSFGWSYGLCFQALDDLTDRPTGATGTTEDRGKGTFVSVLGVEGAWRAAEEYARCAIHALAAVDLGDSSLAALAAALVEGERPRAAISAL